MHGHLAFWGAYAMIVLAIISYSMPLMTGRKKSERYLTEYFQKKRLPDREEPDLDAIVELFADIQTGKTPSENLYFSKRKKMKNIAIILLVDCSLSTDGYTKNRKILDIEKKLSTK
jgi:nitric oxide reductase NorD protein